MSSPSNSNMSNSSEKKQWKPTQWQQEVSQVYEQMKADYLTANPSAKGMTEKDIRTSAKKGDLPPFPTLPMAMMEASRRRCEADADALKHHQEYRDQVEVKQAIKKAAKAAKRAAKEAAESANTAKEAAKKAVESAKAAVETASPPPKPSNQNLIPSIVGHHSASFNCFWRTVEKDPTTSLPVKGTLGVHLALDEDLSKIFDTYGGDYVKIRNHLSWVWRTTWVSGLSPKDGKGRFLSSDTQKQLIDFFAFAEGDQPYFFLRQGKKVLGLCKRTSKYFYEMNPENRWHLPHRFSFEFIRPALPEEQEDFMNGPGKKGITKTLEFQNLLGSTAPMERKISKAEEAALLKEQLGNLMEANSFVSSQMEDLMKMQQHLLIRNKEFMEQITKINTQIERLSS